MNVTLSETVRDLLEPFETADDAGEPVTFDAYLVGLWREALTEALEAAQTLESAVAELLTHDEGRTAYERALERQRKHQEMRSETFADPFDANIIVLPTAALPAEAAFS